MVVGCSNSFSEVVMTCLIAMKTRQHLVKCLPPKYCANLQKFTQLEANISRLKHTHPFNGPFSGTTRVSQYQKGKTNLDFTEARDSEWQWHQLGGPYTSLTDNHTSTPPLSFLQVGCASCRPTNSVKALKASMLRPKCLTSPYHLCI